MNIPHMHRIHVNLSSDDDMAYASALNVDRTTLPICFEFQAIGLISEAWFCRSLSVHATMNTIAELAIVALKQS